MHPPDPFTVIDISPPVSEQSAVFPGDVAYSREVLCDFAKGDNLALSAIRTTVHVGAHTDAPNHYHPDGVGIDERDLGLYIGRCQVIEVDAPGDVRLEPHHLRTSAIKAPRVLLKTLSFPDPNVWQDAFNSLSLALVEHLHANGVRLIGIDTPSVDPADDSELLAHHAIYDRDLAILEGIVLKDVAPGIYRLVALPLKLVGVDASPVRAVLLQADL